MGEERGNPHGTKQNTGNYGLTTPPLFVPMPKTEQQGVRVTHAKVANGCLHLCDGIWVDTWFPFCKD